MASLLKHFRNNNIKLTRSVFTTANCKVDKATWTKPVDTSVGMGLL